MIISNIFSLVLKRKKNLILTDLYHLCMSLGVLNGWLRVFKHQRTEQELMQYEVVEEIIYGLDSSILFGLACVISKMGFVFMEQRFSKLLLPICIGMTVSCSASGNFKKNKNLVLLDSFTRYLSHTSSY